ncbi:1-phosphofructokinase [Selenomonas ruminantium]|jgi:1-phosphofructokinase|uniref:Tagatose-6-phosphate kinase n=2 Tax=Bacillota TaxID=1239 RepID=A0A927WMH9_SELRU|nr:1-phosphofructokinase [Selenomonas ruminantium]MBE6091768.1 1-phosphofructokinase [Selenomonas ruminantium]MBQ1808638.1 1-phosphofructokinase [Selenomonas sp.]
MIYTVTFNPSLDYIVRLDNFTAGEINRVNYEQVLAGGKGINVSIVLKNLGHDNAALGFVAGFTGEEIKRQLKEFGVTSDFVQLDEGFSRINVKAKAKTETEINGQGPDISEAKQAELFAQLDKLVEGDTLVLAGSIPKTLPDDIYQRIMARLDGKGIRIVVDAEKKLLLNVLQYHPFLIKPNNHELGDMFGVKLTTDEEIITYAKKLQEKGAQNVLISMAGDGAILLTAEGKSFKCPAPKGKLINSVGAGDSMVAGFITGYMESDGDFETAFHWGVATGSASAFSENLATRPEVEALLKTIA